MIQNNRHRKVALPCGALDVPDSIDLSTTRNWIDYGLWGLAFYNDQSPWLTLIECLQILHHQKHISRENLFSPPEEGLDGLKRHEEVKYSVPLNFHLRHFLFRDLESVSAAMKRSTDVDEQWAYLIQRTRESWKDLDGSQLEVRYLQNRFEDVSSLARILKLLRSMEIDPYSGKRWTSRHVLPVGRDLLFADVRERTYRVDRRFLRRNGELLYLMLGRSEPRLLEHLGVLLRERVLSTQNPWNGYAALFLHPDPSKRKEEELRTGYLPFARMDCYDRLAEDWIRILSLERMDIADLLDPLMRLSALHQVIYILDRASRMLGREIETVPPFVLDLAASPRKNPVQRIALGQFDIHMKLPRHAIDSCIDEFGKSPYWKSLEDSTTSSSNANRLLAEMWLWPSGRSRPSSKKGTPSDRLDDFRSDSLSKTAHRIWAIITSHTRLAGMVTARPGAGTWYAPADPMLEALVLANIQTPVELRAFLRLLYERYRLVIGPEQAEQAFPGSPTTLERLKQNEHLLEDRLRVLRFIDRKSDACAFVVNPFYEEAADASRRI